MNDESKTKRQLIEELRELRCRLPEPEGAVADSRLKASQAGYRDQQMAEIFNAALDSIISIDHEGKIIEFNPAAERLFGYARRDALGQEMTDLIFPSYMREKHREGLTRYLATGESIILGRRVEVTAQHANGVDFTCELSVVKNRDGAHPIFTGFIRDISKRKQAEERLIASEAKYRYLVDISPEPIGIHNEGRWVYVNPASVDLFGASGPEEILGKPILNFVHPDYRGIVKERVRNELEEGEPAPLVEEKLIRLDGTEIWAEVTAIPITYEEKPASMVLARDITKRKLAEEEVRKKEAQYKSLSSMLRLMCDNMPDMIWAKDINNRYLFANKAMCNNLLHARDTDEPVGKTDMFFAERERREHPDDPAWHTFGELCRDSDTITLQEGRMEQFDEFGNVNGKFLFLDVYKAPIFDDKGDIIGVVGSGRDVTAIKNAEKQLRNLSQATEQSPVAVMITDTKGVIEYVNKKFCTLTGYAPEEIIGENPKALKSGNHSPEFYKFLWKTITSGGEWRGEFSNRKRNGEHYWELASIAPITDEKGNITNYIALKEDITKLKQAEEDKEILQAQLLQSQKLEAIGTLAGGVAHDFNNILTAILGNAELALQKVDEGDSLIRNLINVKEAANRASDLTRQLLLYSRKQSLKFTIFNINHTIDRLFNMVHRLIGENITIATNLAPDLWSTRADEGNIEQVIMNLAVNARDAMPEGGVLTITTENSTIDDEYCKNTTHATPGNFIHMTVVDEL
ncbi:MAG: PAS domain S-box protein [Thermodesulfobacteriota bacterium]